MEKAKSKTTRLCVVLAFALSGVVGAGILLMALYASDTGAIAPVVVNAYTLAPISNAVVTIPDVASAETGADGRALLEDIPVRIAGTRYRLMQRDWAEVTLLVYAPGYLANAVFGVQVRAEETRTGLTVHLFPYGESGREYTATVEPPPDEWTRQLLDHYAPDM